MEGTHPGGKAPFMPRKALANGRAALRFAQEAAVGCEAPQPNAEGETAGVSQRSMRTVDM